MVPVCQELIKKLSEYQNLAKGEFPSGHRAKRVRLVRTRQENKESESLRSLTAVAAGDYKAMAPSLDHNYDGVGGKCMVVPPSRTLKCALKFSNYLCGYLFGDLSGGHSQFCGPENHGTPPPPPLETGRLVGRPNGPPIPSASGQYPDT